MRIAVMIRKIVKRQALDARQLIKEDLEYWLNRSPEERIAAVEFLRRQYDGSSTRLQRSARVIQQAQS